MIKENLPSIIVGEKEILEGDLEIFSIGLSVKFYKEKFSFNPYDNREPILYPTLYNPDNFEPYRKLLLDFPVETPHNLSNEDAKKMIKEKLIKDIDKVLEKPQNYAPPANQLLVIRGRLKTEPLKETVKNIRDLIDSEGIIYRQG